ncbi:hemerythrin domain-containing protein [Treponema pectinovorum]|uniref:hemerythrin domain-containing protein n=1 Tax=Treponema pectinovorum TaxID=164 RepID=UPI0011CCC247|nr:hemerythrin domain-containing protein [Treponema pectinovorum]
MNTDLYISKHRIVQEYLQTIDKLAKQGVKENAAEIALNINKMTGIIKMHLASEDKLLYPELLASKSENVKKITKQYMDEMGDLYKAYGNFAEEFRTPSKIEENSQKFVESFKAVEAALNTRIAREEKELYPLAE